MALSLVTTFPARKHCGKSRITTLIKSGDIRSFEIDDGDSLPIVILVDTEGFHLTQTDNMGLEDHISLSWSHIMGLLEMIETLDEGTTKNVRH